MLKARPSQLYADIRVCCVRLACSQGGVTALHMRRHRVRPALSFASCPPAVLSFHTPPQPLYVDALVVPPLFESMLLWHVQMSFLALYKLACTIQAHHTHTMTDSLYVTCLPMSFLARYKHGAYLWPVPMSFLARYMPAVTLQTQTQRPSPHLFSELVCPFTSWPRIRLSRMPKYVSLFHTMLTRTGTSTSDTSPVAKEVKSVLPLAADSSGTWV